MKWAAQHRKSGAFLSPNTVELVLKSPFKMRRVDTADGPIAVFDTKHTATTVLSGLRAGLVQVDHYTPVPIVITVRVLR